MKISAIHSQVVRLPADEPLAGGPAAPGATRDIVALEVRTDQPGLDGVGLSFFGGPLTGALQAAIDSLGALLVGDDPLRVEAAGEKLRNAASASGPGGIFTLALSALDIALWDIRGKALGVPVATLAG